MTTLRKHRFSGDIAKEIQTLKDIAGCYNHFLASYESSQMQVAKAQIQLNKILIWKEINKLQEEYDNVMIEARLIGKEVEASKPKMDQYKYTELEDKAIMLFNSDKRYTITE